MNIVRSILRYTDRTKFTLLRRIKSTSYYTNATPQLPQKVADQTFRFTYNRSTEPESHELVECHRMMRRFPPLLRLLPLSLVSFLEVLV